MAKSFVKFNVCRAVVKAVTDTGMAYMFEVAPELSDKRVLSLVGLLVDYDDRKPRLQRKERKR